MVPALSALAPPRALARAVRRPPGSPSAARRRPRDAPGPGAIRYHPPSFAARSADGQGIHDRAPDPLLALRPGGHRLLRQLLRHDQRLRRGLVPRRGGAALQRDAHRASARLPDREHRVRVLPPLPSRQLSLELAIGKLGSSSIEFRIRGRVGDEEKFLARHKVALISLDTLRALPIPDDLRAPMLDYVAPSST